MTDDRFERFETVELEEDPEESDEWVLVGHFIENDVPIYYNPDTQEMGWTGENPEETES